MLDSPEKLKKHRIKYSITTKLILVMIMMIIGTTLGTILVIRQQVESSYQRFIREQFSRQIQAFYRTQENRLQAIEALIQKTVKRIYAMPKRSAKHFTSEYYIHPERHISKQVLLVFRHRANAVFSH